MVVLSPAVWMSNLALNKVDLKHPNRFSFLKTQRTISINCALVAIFRLSDGIKLLHWNFFYVGK